MSSIKNLRGSLYPSVRFETPNNNGRTEKHIPLRTTSKVTARERLIMVNQVQDEIIELHNKGEKYNFPWMNKDGKRKIQYLTLKDAVTVWLKLRKSQGIADSTLDRNRQSMNTIMNVLGKSIRLKAITTKSIYRYTQVMS